MNYFGIEPVECNNGTGFGTTLFVAGCEHHCRECFNKKTWNRYGGEPFTEETLRYLLKTIENPNISRLTISGGDPLSVYNRLSVLRICRDVKEFNPEIKIWVYTGYTFQELKEQSTSLVFDLQQYVDYLVDGKYEENEGHVKPFRGSDNQKIWNLKTMQEEQI